MNREEWLKKRQKSIGGSEVSCLLGLNPYMNNVQLWELKTGRRQPENIDHKDYVRYGLDAEKHLVNLFALDFPQFKVMPNRRNTLIKHKKYPFITATLDGKLIELETGEEGVLEVKTTSILQSMSREKWINQIPDNYFCQVVYYLLVTGFSFAYLKAQLKTDYDGDVLLNTRHYKINREEVQGDIDLLLEKSIEFWNDYVLADVCPPLVLPPL